ncbi:DUF6875 domain-containing protein [Streptomyces sp. NPDC048445]|uniref:DUF6875 domain-containing protein n=1 Tax=Streptomyces sp. NPDC048445 TaxID=3365553 RepID=UPI00371FED2C
MPARGRRRSACCWRSRDLLPLWCNCNCYDEGGQAQSLPATPTGSRKPSLRPHSIDQQRPPRGRGTVDGEGGPPRPPPDDAGLPEIRAGGPPRGERRTPCRRERETAATHLARPALQTWRCPGCRSPFMAPALRADGVRARVFPGSVDLDGLLSTVDAMVEVLRGGCWPTTHRALHAVVAVLPDLPQADEELLDHVQEKVRTPLAQEGMMLGQFHSRCDQGAARNPRFPVSRSPVPMLALRWMALHDVLFLHDDPDRFADYEERFGTVYRSGRTMDPLFTRLYQQAHRQERG